MSEEYAIEIRDLSFFRGERLTAGESIADTQGAMILENLVGELITRIGE